MQRRTAAAAAWLLLGRARVAAGVATAASGGRLRAASNTGSAAGAAVELAPAPAPASGLPAPGGCEPWCGRVLSSDRCALEGVCSGCPACAGAAPALAPAPAPGPVTGAPAPAAPALVRVWESFESSSCTSGSNADPFWRGWLHNPIGTIAGCKELCETSRDAQNRSCVAIEVYTHSTSDEAHTLHCNLAWGCDELRPWGGGLVLRKSLGPPPPPLTSAAGAGSVAGDFASENLTGPGGASLADSVSLQVRFEGLDYGSLASAGLLGEVEAAIKAAVAGEAEVKLGDVAVKLSDGTVLAHTVVAHAYVALPAGVTPAAAASELAASPTLSESLLDGVRAIGGVPEAVAGGDLTAEVESVSGVAGGVQAASAHFASAPAPAPAEEGTAELQLAD